jgi:hypothetical protein
MFVEVLAEAEQTRSAGQARAAIAVLHQLGVVSAGVLDRRVAVGPGWICMKADDIMPLLDKIRDGGRAT